MTPVDVGEKVRVIVYTATHRIEGTYSKQPDIRFLDDLNSRRDFIPITNAKISGLLGEPLTQSDFLALNRRLIVFITSPDLEP
mgnify:CR=1 FL=1